MKNRIIFSLAFILFFYSSFQPILAWYSGYTSWNSRMNVTINNTLNSNLLTNYQVWINISYKNGMDPKFNDLRFTYYNPSNGQEAAIPYWVERNLTGQFAETWVNVPSIQANGYTTIYMYYGNPSASSESNGANTFDTFDDFNDNSLNPSIWQTHVKNGGALSETGGELLHDNNPTWSGENTYTVKTFNKNNRLIIDFWIRYPSAYSAGGNNHRLHFFNTGTVSWLDGSYDFPSPATYIDFTGGNSVAYDTQWKITLYGDGTYTMVRLAGTNYISDVTTPAAITNWASITDGFVIDFSSGTYGNHDTYWDDVKIRKYTSPEPTVRMKAESVGTFCCADQYGNKKCWTSGICCLQGTAKEYWDLTGCRDFTVWVQPNKIMFPIGTKNSVVLYVENKGGYTDSYIVDYEKNPNNPNIIVDLTGVTPTASVASGEIKRLYPRITVLTTGTNGDVTFMVNSTQEPTMQRNATLHIMESDYPLSLPEFGVLGLIEIIILVGLVYFFSFLSFKPRKISAI